MIQKACACSKNLPSPCVFLLSFQIKIARGLSLTREDYNDQANNNPDPKSYLVSHGFGPYRSCESSVFHRTVFSLIYPTPLDYVIKIQLCEGDPGEYGA